MKMYDEQKYFGNDWGLFIDIEKGESPHNQIIYVGGNRICVNNAIKHCIQKNINNKNVTMNHKSKVVMYIFSLFSVGIIIYSM